MSDSGRYLPPTHIILHFSVGILLCLDDDELGKYLITFIVDLENQCTSQSNYIKPIEYENRTAY